MMIKILMQVYDVAVYIYPYCVYVILCYWILPTFQAIKHIKVF